MSMKVMHYLGLAFRAAQKVPVLNRFVDVGTSTLACLLRCCSGVWVAEGLEDCKRPEKPLTLYEFEACPFCRKVRETLSVLDLDVVVRPCPRETLKAYGVCEKSRFRTVVKQLGGQQLYPYLVDENTGVKMHDSSAINEYLWKTYGAAAKPPLSYRLGQRLCSTPLFFLPSLCRPLTTHGMLRVPSKAPKEPLELWGCEPSPFVKLVREALCVLELPYVLRNVAHGSSAKRAEFRQKYGTKLSSARQLAGDTVVQMPFLRDPNTGTELLESADIVRYLYSTYQDGPVSSETFLDYSLAGKTAAHGSMGGHGAPAGSKED